ncbi:MAG: hypothetical protein JO076_03945 [Verrucomicrobia bacterium]|nr:hypothetical protein [Verrucomicrobiota bacterium]
MKENRTYDQVLGDLGRGNGDAKLTEFGWSITPNLHQLAKSFVDLDNFYDPGDVSGDGWPWSTSGRESDFGLKAVPLIYADRGTAYEYEGVNRNINVGLSSLAARKKANPDTSDDPDLLPGAINVVAPDGPVDTPAGRGYVWDAALRAELRVRNYGFFVDLSRYTKSAGNPIPRERDPFNAHLQVAYVADPKLIGKTDEYFRGIDLGFPDYYRELEWEREFDNYVKQRALPELELVRFGGDHMGGFDSALDGVNTPEKQQADNDYAVGRLVEKVTKSPYKSDTLIFVVEDDAQNGADHVDSHRSTAYIVGPYIKQGAVISDRYTTVNLLRSIEELLNLDHLNINTASQCPMLKIFDLEKESWNFVAQPSNYLAQTQLPLPHRAKGSSSTHDGHYWAEKTAQFDFSREDNLGDPEAFNRIIWAGLKNNIPYPGD